MTACEVIARQMGDMFHCEPRDGFVRIETPYVYPDGDAIDLYLHEDFNGQSVLTDFGESLQWLGLQSTAQRRSPKQTQIIQETCARLQVRYENGTLRVPVANPEQDLAGPTIRLAQAMMRVADLWFTFRARAFESVADDVAEFLTERHIPFERGPKVQGASERVWTVDFKTSLPDRESLVSVLSTGNRAAARSITEHVTATWFDLRALPLKDPRLKFVSLFDDTSDVWTTEDFNLVKELSEVAYWSRQEDLVQQLAA